MLNKELRNLIKIEITTVYLTSDNRKFLDEYQAVIHESELEEIRKQDRRWEQMKAELTEIVLAVLKNERWGIFFKNEPMQTLPVQDAATTLYKVNEVKEDLLVDAIEKQIEISVEKGENECRENQAINAPQIDEKLSDGTERT
jgi:hypothetical protein